MVIRKPKYMRGSKVIMESLRNGTPMHTRSVRFNKEEGIGTVVPGSVMGQPGQ